MNMNHWMLDWWQFEKWIFLTFTQCMHGSGGWPIGALGAPPHLFPHSRLSLKNIFIFINFIHYFFNEQVTYYIVGVS